MRSTETADPRFVDIDRWPTEAAVGAMLDAQLAAGAALKDQVAAIAAAADAAAARLRHAGRLVYAGAGTSGRIGVQDGVELGPTFGWPSDRLAFLVAGGMGAVIESVEGAEDDGDAARAAVARVGIGANDVVVGIAASGRTRFTIAAIEAAGASGALTIGLANNAQAPLLDAADCALLADTGSEVIAGSTRMAAGTAQKIVLNLLSTAIMLRLGRVYRGRMVDMIISNDKLLGRARAMVAELAGCDGDAAAAALVAGGQDIKAAVLIARGLSPDAATRLLATHDDILRDAMEALERGAA